MSPSGHGEQVPHDGSSGLIAITGVTHHRLTFNCVERSSIEPGEKKCPQSTGEKLDRGGGGGGVPRLISWRWTRLNGLRRGVD